MINIMVFERIGQLIDYAVEKSLIKECDRTWATNRIAEALGLYEYKPVPHSQDSLENILRGLDDYAAEHGLCEDSVVFRDIFDARLMGLLTPPPHDVWDEFFERYIVSPVAATDWYYDFSRATDYIRTYRIAKDVRWTVDSRYGKIDMSINLSKPEKDPRAIAAAKLAPQSSYPKCQLCPECEGYGGRADFPARQNHRIIPVTLGCEDWFLQYSPYVYYNEHCIAFCSEHRPMKINRELFRKQMDFITFLPHYFIGSNADLPIVGGSILSHDHMQGGRYEFAMERAPIARKIVFSGYEDVSAGIVDWPMSVIRITCNDSEKIISLADKILCAWRGYSDEAAFVFAKTDGEDHNAITPIARRRGDDYELDLVLRNNITTQEHPLGVFHPHADKHNIKKENIGLIEVMGLAVLPARLKTEMKVLAETVLSGGNIRENDTVAKHADWFERFCGEYSFTKDNIEEILLCEIGKTFVAVLEDAGVYKRTSEGEEAFMRFVRAIGGR